MLDECTKHDASCVISLVADALEQVAAICRSSHRSMPHTCVLFSDNTVREAKNQYTISYIAALLGKFKTRTFGLMHLRKSHTHDVADQLFGILARRIASCDRLLSPQSVIQVLRQELNRPGLKSWIGSHTSVVIEKVDAVRAWKDHFKPLKVHFSGGLLEDASANHCFVMMLRRDLPEPLANNIDSGSSTAVPNPCDVIMLVKQFISSDNLSQRPLLVLTHGRVQRVPMVPTVKIPG